MDDFHHDSQGEGEQGEGRDQFYPDVYYMYIASVCDSCFKQCLRTKLLRFDEPKIGI